MAPVVGPHYGLGRYQSLTSTSLSSAVQASRNRCRLPQRPDPTVGAAVRFEHCGLVWRGVGWCSSMDARFSARRHLTELPQGREAARVGWLYRVRGEPLFVFKGLSMVVKALFKGAFLMTGPLVAPRGPARLEISDSPGQHCVRGGSCRSLVPDRPGSAPTGASVRQQDRHSQGVCMPSRRIITTDRAGQIWNRITWCCLLIFVLSGLVAMLVQTTLPANLGYPQLHSPGVPDSVTYTVIACEIAAFLVPALLATSCGRKASRLGHSARGAVLIAWAVFAVVTLLVVVLSFVS